MDDEQYRNIAVSLIVLGALILLITKKSRQQLELASFVALALLLGLALTWPFAGMLLAIPIFLVIWMRNQDQIWAWWDKIKSAKLNLGGQQQ